MEYRRLGQFGLQLNGFSYGSWATFRRSLNWALLWNACHWPTMQASTFLTTLRVMPGDKLSVIDAVEKLRPDLVTQINAILCATPCLEQGPDYAA